MIRSRESFGREVLGPITAEFCLRLWLLGSMLEDPSNAAMLFCARGGLRLMLAYERFLSVANLDPPTKYANLMVSRVVAIKPAIVRIAQSGSLPPSAASVLAYEFSDRSLRDVVRAISGCEIGESTSGAKAFTPSGFERLLLSPEGAEVFEAIRVQAALFERHLRSLLDGRRHAVLVDTGLFGTTQQLLGEGIPDLRFFSALIARSSYGNRRRDPRQEHQVIGLSVETDSYSPLQRRSAILRYWHLVESTFEPELPSVQSFVEQDGVAVSNLEIQGWHNRLTPAASDSIFAGVLTYLDEVPRGNASVILADAGQAWNKLYRSVVWPDASHAAILDVGVRGSDFGVDTITASARPWRGPLQALRGHTFWREGDIARSKTRLRLPLLALIEAAYGARRTAQTVARIKRRAKK